MLNWLWPQKSVQGQVVLITGGAMGIGRLMALRFAELGAVVLIWDIDAPCGLQVVQEIASVSGGSEAHFYEVDVADRDRVRATGRQVLEKFGLVDILVNNAGIVSGKPLLETSSRTIERVLAVNTLAHFWTVRTFLPAMLERYKGHIVCISSAAGLFGFPNMVDYGASKFATVGFMCSLRQELRALDKRSIHLTLVCSSFIKTGMFEGVKAPMFTTWLSPGYAADQIVKAVRRNQWRLLMPSLIALLELLVALTPYWVYDFMMRITRTLEAMTHFQQTRVHPDLANSEPRFADLQADGSERS
ncbi:hypothetical protein BBJ28_00013694 [Nothophytophthora sp. Chile5]|nr:hypothetical protein BBJ28_00013694 [Nothophytophthora sp. Chile5]